MTMKPDSSIEQGTLLTKQGFPFKRKSCRHDTLVYCQNRNTLLAHGSVVSPLL